MKLDDFKVGDKIVHFGRMYRIFKIKKRKGIIFFRYHFRTKKNKSLIYSIPVKNIDQVYIRKPLSKNKMRLLLRECSEKEKVKRIKNSSKLKESFNKNELTETLKAMKRLVYEKINQPERFTVSKQNLFKLAMKKIQEETAFIFNISLAKARKKIMINLKKGVTK